MASATENRVINLFVNGKQAGQSLNQIRSAATRLRAEINRGKMSQEEYNQKVKELQKYNKILQDHAMKVRGVNNSWNQLKSVMLGVVGGNLITAGIMRIGSALREAARIVVDYQKANSALQAVLGLTSAETEELRKQQIALGGATQFTASNAAEAQTELAKLGFSLEEIVNLTPAVLDLAAASGTDLANAAKIAGSTIRGFGLDSSETQRVVDVMAKSFSSSALDIEKYNFAMRVVAPVAKNANLSIEETTAMLGVLVDRGVRAESAGTGLRMVLARLAQSGQSWADAMRQINESTNANKTAIELFGIEASTMALILAQNGDALDTLEEKLNNAGGAAKRMAEEQLNNLAGDVVKLTSTWEKLILEIENGEGALGRSARSVTQWATSVVDGLSKINATAEKTEKSWFQMIKVTGSTDAIFQPQKILKNPLLLLGIESIDIDRELIKLENSVRVWSESAQEAFAKGNISDGNSDLAFIREMTNEYKDNEAAIMLINKALSDLEESRKKGINAALGWISTDKSAIEDANEKAEKYGKTLSELNSELSALKESLDGVTSNEQYKQIQIEITSKEKEIEAVTGPSAASGKALEKEAENLKKLQEIIEKAEIDIATSRLEGREKEKAEIEQHYADMAKKAEGHIEELARIEALKNEALRMVDEDYERQYETETQELQQEIALALMSDAEKKIQAENDYWEELIALAKEKGLEYEELERAHQNALKKLKEDGANDREKTAVEEALLQAQIYLEGAAVVVGAIKTIADIQGKNAKFQADMALFQQLINAGLALSNAAASAKGITPIDYLAALATVTVAIFARIQQARQMAEEAGSPPTPEFARGTTNYSGDFIAGDQGREIVSGAQVVPADITQQILAANAFSRSMPQPNFSAINDGLTYTQGRQAQQSSVGGSGGGMMDMGVMVAELREMKSLLARAQDKRVYLVDKDYDEFISRKDRNGARVGIRK